VCGTQKRAEETKAALFEREVAALGARLGENVSHKTLTRAVTDESYGAELHNAKYYEHGVFCGSYWCIGEASDLRAGRISIA
jgi:hypothetical protein